VKKKKKEEVPPPGTGRRRRKKKKVAAGAAFSMPGKKKKKKKEDRPFFMGGKRKEKPEVGTTQTREGDKKNEPRFRRFRGEKKGEKGPEKIQLGGGRSTDRPTIDAAHKKPPSPTRRTRR